MSAHRGSRDAIASAYRALLESTPEQLQEMSRAIASTGVSPTEAFENLAETGFTKKEQS